MAHLRRLRHKLPYENKITASIVSYQASVCLLLFFQENVDTLIFLVYYFNVRHNIDAWLSLVERYVRDVEVAGSNPVASISTLYFSDREFFLLKERITQDEDRRADRRTIYHILSNDR